MNDDYVDRAENAAKGAWSWLTEHKVRWAFALAVIALVIGALIF